MPRKKQQPTIKTPVEALQEESPQLNTEVAETANIAVIEAQEATRASPEPVSDVIVEEIIQSTSNNSTEPKSDTLPERSVTLETIPTVTMRYYGNDVPATQITLRFSRLTDLVKELVYIGTMDAELDNSFLPRLDSPPYLAKVVIPTMRYDKYLARDNEPMYNENLEYSKLRVSGMDRAGWVRKILELSRKGAVISPKKAAISSPILSVELSTRVPMVSQANVNVEPANVLYSKEELDTMTIEQLRIIGDKVGVKHKSKDQLIALIIKAQTERGNRDNN